jgi:hypothetical protein
MPESRISKNQKQGNNVTVLQDCIFDETISLPFYLNLENIQNNEIKVGIDRVQGCFIYRAFIILNGLIDTSVAHSLLPDIGTNMCAAKVFNYKHVAILNDRLQLRCLWKKGDNPKGVLLQNNVFFGNMETT